MVSSTPPSFADYLASPNPRCRRGLILSSTPPFYLLRRPHLFTTPVLDSPTDTVPRPPPPNAYFHDAHAVAAPSFASSTPPSSVDCNTLTPPRCRRAPDPFHDLALPPPTRTAYGHHSHISTARILSSTPPFYLLRRMHLHQYRPRFSPGHRPSPSPMLIAFSPRPRCRGAAARPILSPTPPF